MQSGLALLLLCGVTRITLAAEPSPPASLAVSLSGSGNHAGSALEFRRQALETTAEPAKSSLFWCAAHEYHQAGDYEIAEAMLDAVENSGTSLLPQAILLRGENSSASRDWHSSSFYFRSLASAGNTNMARYAARRLAVAEMFRRQTPAARQALLAAGTDESIPLAALDRYEQGRDKRPWLGGLLGMVPGLGYAYSGEYANAGRSLILNALFIFGMVNTAENENWGAFTAISFFELTWYSGSIYGGVDAAHRHNEARRETCAGEIMHNTSFTPDYATLPALTIQFEF